MPEYWYNVNTHEVEEDAHVRLEPADRPLQDPRRSRTRPGEGQGPQRGVGHGRGRLTDLRERRLSRGALRLGKGHWRNSRAGRRTRSRLGCLRRSGRRRLAAMVPRHRSRSRRSYRGCMLPVDTLPPRRRLHPTSSHRFLHSLWFSVPLRIQHWPPREIPVDGVGQAPENVSTLWQGEGMEEFGDPAQGQNRASMPDLAAAIAAVALPVVPAVVPVADPPLVRFPDRAHPGCRWRRPGRGRTPRRTGTQLSWPRSPNSPGWKPAPRP